MACLARASKSIPFDLKYGSLPSELRALLDPVGLDKATVWANLQSLEFEEDEPDWKDWLHNSLIQILADLGEKERGNEWAVLLLPLILLAKEIAPELAARQGSLSSLELMSDFHDLDTAARHSARTTELQGMAIAALPGPPPAGVARQTLPPHGGPGDGTRPRRGRAS